MSEATFIPIKIQKHLLEYVTEENIKYAIGKVQKLLDGTIIKAAVVDEADPLL